MKNIPIGIILWDIPLDRDTNTVVGKIINNNSANIMKRIDDAYKKAAGEKKAYDLITGEPNR